MNIRQKLTLEQQFELQVFENEVQNISLKDARELLVQLHESMLYQTTTFRTILKESWGIGENVDLINEILSEG
ncbi:MAG: NblA/ycf18 family protein [Cyanobacteria bacterium P01_C01_bin.120]